MFDFSVRDMFLCCLVCLYHRNGKGLIGVYKEKVMLMFTVNSLDFKKNNTRKALNTTKRVQEGSKKFFINNCNLLCLYYLNIHNHPRFHLIHRHLQLSISKMLSCSNRMLRFHVFMLPPVKDINYFYIFISSYHMELCVIVKYLLLML